MRYLVVEDERDLNEIICRHLRAEGGSVDVCFDGAEAIHVLSYVEYDAVILDIMMPKADGYAVLRSLQTCEAGGVRYYVFDQKLSGENLEGLWLRGVVAQTQGNVQLGTVARLSLLLMPLLVLLAVVGGWMIAGRMLRPIRAISAAAEEITADGDLRRRIELAPGSDELHRLAGSFNRMLDRLETSFEKERRFTADVSHELRTHLKTHRGFPHAQASARRRTVSGICSVGRPP